MKVQSLHLTAGFLITTSVIHTGARPFSKHALHERQEAGGQYFSSQSSGYSTSSQMTPDGVVSKTTTLFGTRPITTSQTYQTSPGTPLNPAGFYSTTQTGNTFPNMGGIFNGPMLPSSLPIPPLGMPQIPALNLPTIPALNMPSTPALSLPPIPTLNIPTLDNPFKALGQIPSLMFPSGTANGQMQAQNTVQPSASQGLTPSGIANGQMQAQNTAQPLPSQGLTTTPTSGRPLAPQISTPIVQPANTNTPISPLGSSTAAIPTTTNSLTQASDIRNTPSTVITPLPTPSQQGNNIPHRASNLLAQASNLLTQNPNATVQSVDASPRTSTVTEQAQPVRPVPSVLAVASNVTEQVPVPTPSQTTPNAPQSTTGGSTTLPMPVTPLPTPVTPLPTLVNNSTRLGLAPAPTSQETIPVIQNPQTQPPIQATNQTLENVPPQVTENPNRTNSPNTNQPSQNLNQTLTDSNQTALINSSRLPQTEGNPLNAPTATATIGTNQESEGGRNSTRTPTRPFRNFPILAIPNVTNPSTPRETEKVKPKLPTTEEPQPIVPHIPSTTNTPEVPLIIELPGITPSVNDGVLKVSFQE